MGVKKKDRSGELFQNAFTENEGARRSLIEQAQHDLAEDPDLEGAERLRLQAEQARGPVGG